MKRLLFALLLVTPACVRIVPVETPKPLYTATSIIEESIIRMEIRKGNGLETIGSCTAFSVAPRKFLTAAHCTPSVLYNMFTQEETDTSFWLGFQQAWVLRKDEEMDVALLVSDIDIPAVSIKDGLPERFEAVKAIGYGYGLKMPTVTEHKVMFFNYYLDGEHYPVTFYLHPFIGGMSGGPVYDEQGRVVGMVQRSTTAAGLGVSAEVLNEFLSW